MFRFKPRGARALLVTATLLSLLVVLIPFSYAGAAAPDNMAAMPMAQSQATDALPTTTACSPDVVPIGQANPPGSQLEPLRPIWCFNPLAAPGAPSRVTGANDWVDGFDTVTQMGRFNDGDYDYRMFQPLSACNGFKVQRFTNNQHWMPDELGASTCGSMIRPNRSFHFENGKLVVEQDVAAGITGYAQPGSPAFAEIDISTGDHPLTNPVDPLYGYGQFRGQWAIGCRLQIASDGQRASICSVESASQSVPNNAAACNEAAPSRLMEISAPGSCGTTHVGGASDSPLWGSPNWRVCDSAAQSPDMMCRDRFRLELTQSSLTLYVNGALFFQDAGWPVDHQIDPAVIANGQWYAYATDWELATPANTAYRFHWDNFRVNPHNPDGTFTAPSAAPNFCLGQPNNTCMAATPVPTNTPASSTSTPVPPTATSVPPTATSIPATATPSVAPCRAWVSDNGGAGQWQAQPNAFCGLP